MAVKVSPQAAPYYEKMIQMFTDGNHGDAATREEVEFLIENRREYTPEEMAEILGAAAVTPFMTLCDKLGL